MSNARLLVPVWKSTAGIGRLELFTERVQAMLNPLVYQGYFRPVSAPGMPLAFQVLNGAIASTRSPGQSDDSLNAGAVQGCLWYNSTTQTFYICQQATPGHAIWKQLTQTAGPGLALIGGALGLTNTFVEPGQYGNAFTIPQFTVDAQGRLQQAAQLSVSIDASQVTRGLLALARGGTAADLSKTGGPGRYVTQPVQGGPLVASLLAAADIITALGYIPGTLNQAVIRINTGSALIGGPITGSGTIDLANTFVLPGQYGNKSTVPQFTVDQKGRLTQAQQFNIQLDGSQIVSGTVPLARLPSGIGTTYTADESTLHLSGTTFSIKSTYAGQTSIVTVGTIATGVWNGTPLVAAYLPSLDAITAPAASVSMNTHTITNVVDPVNPQDAATKNYVDTHTSVTAGSVSGFQLAYLDTTDILVRSGYAADSTNAAVIHMADDWVQLAVTTPALTTIGKAGQTGGLDRFFLATGTATTSNGSAAVVGTSTSFLTAFGTRNLLVGTIGTGGAATTTIAGTSTHFLSEVAVGDLIGNSSVGYSRVTAVASDTSLTVASNLTIANGSTGTVIENAWLQLFNDGVQQINAIADNTHLTLVNTITTGHAGQTVYAGPIPTATVALFVWAGTGGSGTGVFLSTQRTTPFGLTGYNTNVRRIGSIMWIGGSTLLLPFSQTGNGQQRQYQLEINFNSYSDLILSGGTATAWTALVPNTLAPPTASQLTLLCQANVTAYSNLRKRNTGEASTNRPTFIPNTASYIVLVCACDGAQAIEYANSVGGGSTFIYVAGYTEWL